MNAHLVTVAGFEESRMKYKHLSHQLKSCCVKYNCTIISTVEYRKLITGVKPTNSDLAESQSLAYDSNAIMHMYSDLHSRRNDSDLYHWSHDGINQYPILSLYFGKNKISSYKGNQWLKAWPDKAFFSEITEQESIDIIKFNMHSRHEDEDEDE